MSDENTERRGSQTNHPSMIGGHAKYIQGVISSTLGYSTGEDTKKDALQEMRAANEESKANTSGPNDQPAQSSILGTVEKKLGELTGCEGMVEEGAQRVPAQTGSEEASGTG